MGPDDKKTIVPSDVDIDEVGGISRQPTRDAGLAGRATIVDDQDVEARIEAAVSKVAGDSADDVDPLIGKVIDNRFEVLSRLGAGGMGVVYRARQVGIDRIVAIKTLLKDRAQDGKVVMRFKNEARAVSRLNHPNTIRIHDFGQMDDGTLYFAMELLEGRPLDKAIRQDGPFSARRTLHVMTQMADSLAEAHSKGIVHRDLKPENVYLCPIGDDPDFVKVLDFGVARMKEQDHSQGTMTQAGVIFGTPRYMAPEQARTMAVDARADIYALGVIWFEMLTGRTPFDADNPLAILMKHLQDAVPPMAAVRPDVSVPPEVEALVRKCLEKSPEKRFQSAAALAADARALVDRLDGRYERVIFVDKASPATPVEASAPVVVPEPVITRRRRPAALITLVSVLAVLGTVAGIGLTMFMRGADGESSVQAVIADNAVPVPGAAPDAVPVQSPSVAASPPAVDATGAVDAARMVKVRFESNPPGATVVFDEVDLGVTPLDVELSGDSNESVFLFRLADHSDVTVTAKLDRDVTLSAVMTPVQQGRSPRKGRDQGSSALNSEPASGRRGSDTAPVSAPAPAPASAPAPEPVVAKPASVPPPVPAPAPASPKGFEKIGDTAAPKAPGKVGDLKKF